MNFLHNDSHFNSRVHRFTQTVGYMISHDYVTMHTYVNICLVKTLKI